MAKKVAGKAKAKAKESPAPGKKASAKGKPASAKAAPVKPTSVKPEKEGLSSRDKPSNHVADTSTPEIKKRWHELKEKHGDETAPAYSMSGQFEANQPIKHKVLGWGFIQANNNDRLEVLFETGVKVLISNYKP